MQDDDDTSSFASWSNVGENANVPPVFVFGRTPQEYSSGGGSSATACRAGSGSSTEGNAPTQRIFEEVPKAAKKRVSEDELPAGNVYTNLHNTGVPEMKKKGDFEGWTVARLQAHLRER